MKTVFAFYKGHVKRSIVFQLPKKIFENKVARKKYFELSFSSLVTWTDNAIVLVNGGGDNTVTIQY